MEKQCESEEAGTMRKCRNMIRRFSSSCLLSVLVRAAFRQQRPLMLMRRSWRSSAHSAPSLQSHRRLLSSLSEPSLHSSESHCPASGRKALRNDPSDCRRMAALTPLFPLIASPGRSLSKEGVSSG